MNSFSTPTAPPVPEKQSSISSLWKQWAANQAPPPRSHRRHSSATAKQQQLYGPPPPSLVRPPQASPPAAAASVVHQQQQRQYVYDTPTERRRGLIEILCPGFRPQLICAILTVLQGVTFSMIVLSGSSFEHLFLRFGVSGFEIAKRFEIWRLLTALWIHHNFGSFFLCTFCHLQISVFLEARFGKLKWMELYAVCGVIGGLLGSACSPELYLSACPAACLGMPGFQIGEILLVLPQLISAHREYKIAGACAVALCVVQLSVATLCVPNTTIYANAGGFLVGVLYGVMWSSKMEISRTLYLSLRTILLIAVVAVVVQSTLSLQRLRNIDLPDAHFLETFAKMLNEEN